eukprot:gene24627-29754_t
MSLLWNLSQIISRKLWPLSSQQPNMLDFLFAQWNNSSPPALTAQDSPTPASSSSSPSHASSNVILTSMIDALVRQTKVSQGKCRNLSACMSALTLTLPLLQAHPLTSSQGPLLDSYRNLIRMLEVVESSDLRQNSFGEKHVLVVEGLKGSGKSAITQALKDICPSIQVINPRSLDIYALMLQILTPNVLNAFPFLSPLCHMLLNYYVAWVIVASTDTIFLVEEFYHAFVVQNVPAGEVEGMAPCALQWPLDLPLPELVLYLTCPRDVRAQRCVLSATPEEDAQAEHLYSLIKGAGTVGLEAHTPLRSLLDTVLQALHYFGVYAVSEAAVPLPEAAVAPDTYTEQYSYSYGDDCNYGDVDDGSKENWTYNTQASSSPPPAVTAGKKRSSKDKSRRRESREVIASRRMSLGVYGMYNHL